MSDKTHTERMSDIAHMTPAELRVAAEDVDNWTDPTGNAHVVAEAARRLADVIDYAEREMRRRDPGSHDEADAYEVASQAARIARGETNEREEP